MAVAAVVAECEKVWVEPLSRYSCLSRFLWYVPPFAAVVDGSAARSCCFDTLAGSQAKAAAIPEVEWFMIDSDIRDSASMLNAFFFVTLHDSTYFMIDASVIIFVVLK